MLVVTATEDNVLKNMFSLLFGKEKVHDKFLSNLVTDETSFASKRTSVSP